MNITDNTRIWIHGIGSAFIGAVANSASAMLVDPQQFNLTSLAGFRHILLASLISGIVAVTFYLKASPLPPAGTIVTEEHLDVKDGDLTAHQKTVTTTQVER